MGKYYLKSLCALDYFLKSKFLWTISIYGVKYFSRALWIFVWNILKHNIVEFRGFWGSIFSNHCVPWTTFRNQNFFGLFPNAELNTLSRALWIFIWNVLKHNIVEFRGLWGSICSNHCVLWTTSQNQNFFGLFPNAGRNTLSRALWIFVWNVLKHNIVEFCGLWGSICSNHCVLWTTSRGQNFFELFPNAEWNALSTALWIFVCIILKHDIVEFHANGQVIIAQITDCNDCFTTFQVTIFLNFHDRNRTFGKLQRLNTWTSGRRPRTETNFVFDPPFCHVCLFSG